MAALINDLDEHAGRLARDIQQHCTNAQTRLNNVLKQTDIQPKAALYSLLLFAAFTYFTIAATNLIRARRQNNPRPSTPNLEKRGPFKTPDRPPGVWPPSDFTRPPATPYPSFSLTTTKPLPYRPFRHGPKYNITMGLRNMNWDEWIELDNHYMQFHDLKARRIEERGAKCIRTAPEAVAAAVELLEELSSYLPQRYPTVFQTIPPSEGMENGFRNLATGEIFDVERLERNGGREDAMEMCARLVQDDLAIMVEREDGQYYLLAGAILLAGFWRLEDKFGMPLSTIHTSGDVPGYVLSALLPPPPSFSILLHPSPSFSIQPQPPSVERDLLTILNNSFKTKLEKPMSNFFRRIQPQSPVLRNNYFIQVDDNLAWSSSIGPEDTEGEGGIGWFTAEKNKAVEHHWFRSERQSLRRYVIRPYLVTQFTTVPRSSFLLFCQSKIMLTQRYVRLPKSGGVVFTIRTYFHPITEIAQEPYVPGRLASAIRSWGDDVSRYKGREMYGDVLLEYLDRKHQEQVEAGLDVDAEDGVRGYPF
ncbi:uncharacterized protein J4E88_009124 [Alternaria novae-zelandiae]|uniref:uncharacterized protein n=1 Tax=Alternaria novae-zelandiae TaxID=430562 RepID=UPI0020C2B70A|nr:uncharacterized protein J4E88_009124 [Alternaria novae-zelandiae]KAI4671459.1 hypothetical protein J4E88_009124 [Alternaria novae-zelandiae]